MIKRMSFKKKLIIVLCTALLCAYMYVFDPSRPITLTIGFYADSPWDVPYASPYKVIDHAIERFEKIYPNVTITYESGISKSEYSSWLSNQIVEAKQPDVFLVPEDDFNLLSSTRVLEDLSSRIIDDHLFVDDFFDCAYQAGTYSDYQYALPYECNPTLMCVNNDLLKTKGIDVKGEHLTTAEFSRICEKVTDIKKGLFGETNYTWRNAIQAYGAKLFDETGSTCYFNTTGTRQALSYAADLYALKGNYKVTSRDFDAGNVAFIPMTLAEYRTYLPYPYRVAKYSTFNWTCIEMPTKDDECHTPVQTSLFAMSAKSMHKDLAWEFLKLLTTDQETQKDLMAVSSGSSVLKSVVSSHDSQIIIDTDEMSANALSNETLLSIMNHGTVMPYFKKFTASMKYADYLIADSLGKGTIDMDLAEIQRKMQNYLK